MTTHDLDHVAGQRPARLRAHGRLAGLLALLSLGALGLAGCPRLPAFLGGKEGPLDELRSYLAKGRPLVAEAGKRCPLTPAQVTAVALVPRVAERVLRLTSLMAPGAR
ncbi:MAG: hypothetical protein MUF64_31050 [Polyangiaceae bacterium]|nr:hypothetical protein [Polyangiaceae bacterium]